MRRSSSSATSPTPPSASASPARPRATRCSCRSWRAWRACRFRHPLLRRAVYDAAPPAWRLAAHERVAAALQERGAGASVRAFHVEKCARPGDTAAVALLRDAADAAADTAPATAARWYAAGARLLPCAERERRAELLGRMARALAGSGRLHESREALLDVLAL